MSALARLAALLLAALAAALLSAAAAFATVPPGLLDPLDVNVDGGEDSWHPQPHFLVTWHRDASVNHRPFPEAIDYVVRAADGSVVVARRRMPWEEDHIQDLAIPEAPGRYTAEIWLEGESEEGRHVSAQLLFDDAHPGTPPASSPAWFAAGSEPRLTVEPPLGPLPLSGLAGYAAAVDGGEPCGGHAVCTAEELDVDAHPHDRQQAVDLGGLSEGMHVARVLAVSGSGVPSSRAATVSFGVDLTRPTVNLTGLPAGWAKAPVTVTAEAADALSGMAAAGAGGPVTTIAVDDGVASVSPGPRASATVSGSGAHTVSFDARDAAGNPAEGGHALVRIDEDPPRVAFARSQDPAEPERIVATVADGLSGPDPDRGSIGVRPAGTAQRFESLPTTASAGRLTATWDSDAYPAGSYEFRATAYDRADNSASSGSREDGTAMVLANPLKQPVSLQFGFGGRSLVWQRCARTGEGRRCRRQVIRAFAERPSARSVGYGHGVAVGGRLATATGTPLGGLPVELVETFDRGAGETTRTTVVETRADGSFGAHLGPGPSRTVEARFPGSRVLGRADGDALRLRVLAAVRLRASTATATVGGPPVLFSGRVASQGAPLPASGRPVELQFRVPGGAWSEFRTVQTDAHGRFHYAYAFADDDSRGVRFQFRAYAPAEEGWPYEAAASRPVFVTGK